MSEGIVYVAIGPGAQREARASIDALRRHSTMATHTIETIGGGASLSPMQASRWRKVNLDLLTPFDLTLYLDADTRPNGDLSAGFDILADGWDVAIVPSENQGEGFLWHVGDAEREETRRVCGDALVLQAGVFFFAKNTRTKRFFKAWRAEWKRYKDQDQGAFLRALYKAPLKIWLLGRPWNGGAVVQHLFGRCRG